MVHLKCHGGRKCCPEAAVLAAYHDDAIAKESACLTSNARRSQSSSLQRFLTWWRRDQSFRLVFWREAGFWCRVEAALVKAYSSACRLQLHSRLKSKLDNPEGPVRSWRNRRWTGTASRGVDDRDMHDWAHGSSSIQTFSCRIPENKDFSWTQRPMTITKVSSDFFYLHDFFRLQTPIRRFQNFTSYCGFFPNISRAFHKDATLGIPSDQYISAFIHFQLDSLEIKVK